MLGLNEKPSVLGGTMIVAGTAIGAGMLALPTISAGMWLWYSIALLFISWMMMLFSSQALLEVNLNYKPGASFHTLVQDNLGKFWNLINGLSVAFVLYILIYAYISGGGSVVEPIFKSFFGIDSSSYTRLLSGIFFALFLSGCVWWSTYAVDRISVIMIGGMVLTFIFAMSGMLGEIKIDFLLNSTSTENNYTIYIFAALSTYLTSFCFHASVPSLVKYFGKDPISINKCLLYGTFIAFFAYVVWIIASDGNIAREGFKQVIAEGGNVDDLLRAAGAGLNSSLLIKALEIFSFLAVATSFLGAGLGLFDYMADLCGFDDSRLGRTKTLLVTFLPPLIFASIYPDGFLYAIGWAGLAATIWSVIIPALLLKASREKGSSNTYRVKGGMLTIYMLLIFGVIVAVCHILLVFEKLPMYQ